MIRGLFDPFITGAGVGAECFQIPFPIIVKERPMHPESAGIRRIDEGGRVASAHLEEDAHLEFTQSFSAQVAADIIVSIAGRDDMKAAAGTFGNKVQQHGGRFLARG